MPSVWPIQCSSGLHQATEANIGTPPSPGNMLNNVPGRHASNGTVQGGARGTAIADHLSSREVRVCNQQGEIPIMANPEDPVSGLSNRLSSHEDPAESREDNTNCKDMQEITPGTISHSLGASSANRKTDSNTASHIPSPTVVQGTPASEESVYTEVLSPGDITHTDRGGHAGTGVVGYQERMGRACWPDNPVMETDASMLGWGVVCSGIRTGGLWSEAKCHRHINYLELLAVTFAVKAFTKKKKNLHILLKMDNRTAVFYVNRMGGTWSHLMSQLAIQLWQWCLEKNLSLSAVHLPGASNCVADDESRTIQSSAEWHLDQRIFSRIVETLGECSVDLFATWLKTQFIS